MTTEPTPAALSLGDVLGAMRPGSGDAALWGNIVLLHLWGAVGYLKPGWLPALAGVMQFVMMWALFYQRVLEEKLSRATRAPNVADKLAPARTDAGS